MLISKTIVKCFSDKLGYIKASIGKLSFMPKLVFFLLFFLARYRNQTSQAESYYRHAAQLVPSNGESGIPFTFMIAKEDLGYCFS